MDIQARISAALAAVHNFIFTHEVDDMADIPDPTPGNIPVERKFGTLSQLVMPRSGSEPWFDPEPA